MTGKQQKRGVLSRKFNMLNWFMGIIAVLITGVGSTFITNGLANATNISVLTEKVDTGFSNITDLIKSLDERLRYVERYRLKNLIVD